MESDETPDNNPNMVNDIVKSLVPALVLALKEVTKERVTDNVDTDLGIKATDKNTKFRDAEKGTQSSNYYANQRTFHKKRTWTIWKHLY